MENTYLPEINLIGEKHVEHWLIENGYYNMAKEPLQQNEQGIIATGKVENILIQVRTFLHPHKPFKLSDYEIDLLTRRALKLRLIAYAAYVTIDEDNNLATDIYWERLN